MTMATLQMANRLLSSIVDVQPSEQGNDRHRRKRLLHSFRHNILDNHHDRNLSNDNNSNNNNNYILPAVLP